MMFDRMGKHVGDYDLVGVTRRHKITIYAEIPAANAFHTQIPGWTTLSVITTHSVSLNQRNLMDFEIHQIFCLSTGH